MKVKDHEVAKGSDKETFARMLLSQRRRNVDLKDVYLKQQIYLIILLFNTIYLMFCYYRIFKYYCRLIADYKIYYC